MSRLSQLTIGIAGFGFAFLNTTEVELQACSVMKLTQYTHTHTCARTHARTHARRCTFLVITLCWFLCFTCTCRHMHFYVYIQEKYTNYQFLYCNFVVKASDFLFTGAIYVFVSSVSITLIQINVHNAMHTSRQDSHICK